MEKLNSSKSFEQRNTDMTRDDTSSASTFLQESYTSSFSQTTSRNIQRVNMTAADSSPSAFFQNFMQESREQMNQLLEERGFTPIPPPAGFGTPTRPASLLKDFYLDDSSQNSSASNNKSPVKHFSNYSRQILRSSNWNNELPVSPLSPPSPFQHPFFKRQLGMTADPWARFSGFGMPKLTPLINHQHRELIDKRFSQTFDLHNRKSDSNILEGRIIKIRHVRTGSADEVDAPTNGDGSGVSNAAKEEDGDEVLVVERLNNGNATTNKAGYRLSSSHSLASFSSTDTQAYKMCRKSQFYSDAFGEGVSETESEEDEEDASTPTPQRTERVRSGVGRRRIGSEEFDTRRTGSFATLERDSSVGRRGVDKEGGGADGGRVSSYGTLERESSAGRLRGAVTRRGRSSEREVYGSNDELNRVDLLVALQDRDSCSSKRTSQIPSEVSDSSQGDGEDYLSSSGLPDHCDSHSRRSLDLDTSDPVRGVVSRSHRHAVQHRSQSQRNSYASACPVGPFSVSHDEAIPSSTTCPELSRNENNEKKANNVSVPEQPLASDAKNSARIKETIKQSEGGIDTTGKDTNSSGPWYRQQSSKDDTTGPTSPDNVDVLAADSSDDALLQHPRKTKAYRIALELLTTEKTYVQVLHLIDQEFQFKVDQENRAHQIFPSDHIPQMFSNVKSIYKLHHDFLLPQLEDRLQQWESNPNIGDIMVKFAPFLKMYTEYVRNFDHAMTLINSCQNKCPRFANIMAQIHQLEACGQLTLQHHMLSPVQRIPRYELLLRDYLRKLPPQHNDRHDTTKALHLVATAASHANDAMKKIDKFQKLLEVQENIIGCVDLVSPTRELIKQGKIIKISARSGDHQERYLYLVSDLLLLCSPRLGGRVMHGPQHKLRAKYNVENLHVVEGDNLETANTFYIRDASKTVELYTQTLEEKEAWLAALFCAIKETYQRKSSLKLPPPFDPNEEFGTACTGAPELGSVPPLLVAMDSVNKCMKCSQQFSMVRRRHHCRACGSVVCGKCSSHKACLAYENGRSAKVCRDCYAKLTASEGGGLTPVGAAEDEPSSTGGDSSASSSRLSSMDGGDLVFRTRGVLEVAARTPGAIIEGELQLKTHRKAWQLRWFTLHPDFVLYSFNTNIDETALTATPLPGYTVTLLQGCRSDSSTVCDKDRERAFKLHYSKKQYFFLAPTKEDCARWVLQLQRAARAEIPPPDELQ